MATRTEHEMERNVARMDSSPVAPLATCAFIPEGRRRRREGRGEASKKEVNHSKVSDVASIPNIS